MRKATESHQGIPAGLLLSRGLQAFLVACRTGSLSAAARETGVTPSAVSQTITRLEAELGVELFDRSKRPLAPTADGRLLYESLQSHLSALTGTLQAVQTRNFIKPAVRIGRIESLGRNVCPPCGRPWSRCSAGAASGSCGWRPGRTHKKSCAAEGIVLLRFFFISPLFLSKFNNWLF